MPEQESISTILGNLSTVAATIVALVTLIILVKSEKKNRAIVKAEANMDGGERTSLNNESKLVIPLTVRVWNEGYVDSAIKEIYITDSEGHWFGTIDLTFGEQKKTVALLSGQIQDFNFWFDVGGLPLSLQTSTQTFYSRDDMRTSVDNTLQERFSGLQVVIELTNHKNLVGYLPDPFYGTPKADPYFPHIPGRHLHRKIPFYLV